MPPVKASAVARGQLYLLLAQLARLALFLLVTRYLGSRLAPGDFGFFALVSSLFAVTLEVLDAGTSAAVTRAIAQQRVPEHEALATVLAWRRLLALALALACLGLAVSPVAGAGTQRIIVLAAAVGLYSLHLSAYQMVFQIHQTYGKPLLLGLALQVAFLCGSLIALKYAAGAWIALLVVVREIAQVIGSRWLAIQVLGTRIQARLSRVRLQQLWRETWQFGVCALLYKLAFHAGTFAIWLLASPEALGSYSASVRLFSPVVDLSWAFATPLIAGLSLIAHESSATFRAHLRAHIHFHLGTALVFATCGWMLAPVILEVLYGTRYLSGTLSSLDTFRWLCLAFSFAILTPVLVVATLARRQESGLLSISVIGLAINIGVNLYTVPHAGAHGAAIASCATEAFIFFALLVRLTLTGDWRPAWRTLGYALPALLLAGLLRSLTAYPHAALGAAIVISPFILLALWQRPEQKAIRRTHASAAVSPEIQAAQGE